MDASGFMTVCAVSGSIVFLTMHAHNRLLSDFFQKMEFQIYNSPGAVKCDPKKKVRLADEEEVAADKVYGKKHRLSPPTAVIRRSREGLESMPQNWQVMYKGILKSRNHVIS